MYGYHTTSQAQCNGYRQRWQGSLEYRQTQQCYYQSRQYGDEARQYGIPIPALGGHTQQDTVEDKVPQSDIDASVNDGPAALVIRIPIRTRIRISASILHPTAITMLSIALGLILFDTHTHA